jgi:hypothetical protein
LSVGVTTGGGVFPGASGRAAGATGIVGAILAAETGIATSSSHASAAGMSTGRARRELARAFKELRFLGAGRAHAHPIDCRSIAPARGHLNGTGVIPAHDLRGFPPCLRRSAVTPGTAR